jgi:hypothetical protein
VALRSKKWTLSGEVLLVGDTPGPIKLGGFYTRCNDFYYASQRTRTCTPASLVSNAVEISAPSGSFELHVDVSALSPAAGDYIYLILWADMNANDAYDAGEEWRYVIPLFEDCIFQEARDCVFYYDDKESEAKGTAPGWNHSIGLNLYRPLADVHLEQARLSNEAAWSATVTACSAGSVVGAPRTPGS